MKSHTVPGEWRHVELDVMESNLYTFAAKSEEDVEAYGRRRIELWISWREESTGLGRRTAVEVERTLGTPSWTPAFHLVLTCTPVNETNRQQTAPNIFSLGGPL